MEKNTEYSAHIYVGERSPAREKANAVHSSVEEWEKLLREMKEEEEQLIYLYDVALQKPDEGEKLKAIISNMSMEQQEKILHDLMEQILQKIFSMSDENRITATQLESLIHIYVECELWLHSMNMQYYARKNSFAVRNAKRKFLESRDKIKDALEEKTSGNARFLYEYALLWCEMKVNEACDFCQEILYFSMNGLVGRCMQLCETYPEFSNAKVLTGLCYEPSVNSANEALWAFSDALCEIKEECFSAHVYYWMGKRYDSYDDKKEEAKRSYQLAEQSKGKFRTIFKLAVLARDAENYDEAVELFQTIVDRLDVKSKMNFNDPLELEYLFKSYTQMCYIYHKSGQYIKAIEAGKMAIDIKETFIENNLFFKVFYGDEGKAQEYKDILRDRLDLNMAYWLLADSYKKQGDDSNGEHYQLLYEKTESDKDN